MKTKMNRRHFLATSAAAAAATAIAVPKMSFAAGVPRHVILVLATGGWDTTYALDPKPGLSTVDVPSGSLQMFGNLPIFTDPSRPAVESFFTMWADQTAVINGINTRSIAHPECMKRVMTGTQSSDNPDVAAITAFTHGADLALPYLVLGNNAFSGYLASATGRVGPTNQIVALLDPTQDFPNSQAPYIPDGAGQSLIDSYQAARAARIEATRGSLGYNAARVRDFQSSLDRVAELRTIGNQFGNRGVTLSLDAQLTLAADAIERGLSHSVLVEDRNFWDTHGGNDPQNAYHDTLFASLDGLLTDLASRPGAGAGSTLLDETVVVVTSEMTRTPKLNGNGGKDHWPYASVLVAGAGVAGGRPYGVTNDDYEGEPINLTTGDVDSNAQILSPSNVTAGILELVGVPSGDYLPTEPLSAFIL